MKKWKITFQVTGICPPPLDMFRRDECFPATERDAGIAGCTFTPGASPMTISLTTYAENKNWWPNEARWKSFGWTVHPNLVAVKLP